jgi:hypothetical protein
VLIELATVYPGTHRLGLKIVAACVAFIVFVAHIDFLLHSRNQLHTDSGKQKTRPACAKTGIHHALAVFIFRYCFWQRRRPQAADQIGAD